MLINLKRGKKRIKKALQKLRADNILKMIYSTNRKTMTIKIFARLMFLLALIFMIPAFSQTTPNICSANNPNYWTMLIMGNQSKDIVSYELKVNDDSPNGYLGETSGDNPANQTKNTKGSALPLSDKQDNAIYLVGFSCTATPMNLTLKATKNNIETTCTAQVTPDGNITTTCPSDSFVSSNSNNFIFK